MVLGGIKVTLDKELDNTGWYDIILKVTCPIMPSPFRLLLCICVMFTQLAGFGTGIFNKHVDKHILPSGYDTQGMDEESLTGLSSA